MQRYVTVVATDNAVANDLAFRVKTSPLPQALDQLTWRYSLTEKILSI